MNRRLAEFLVFLASAAVLVIEIAAVRLMAPYVGQTLETFTAIISTVLAGSQPVRRSEGGWRTPMIRGL